MVRMTTDTRGPVDGSTCRDMRPDTVRQGGGVGAQVRLASHQANEVVRRAGNRSTQPRYPVSRELYLEQIEMNRRAACYRERRPVLRPSPGQPCGGIVSTMRTVQVSHKSRFGDSREDCYDRHVTRRRQNVPGAEDGVVQMWRENHHPLLHALKLTITRHPRQDPKRRAPDAYRRHPGWHRAGPPDGRGHLRVLRAV